MLRVVNPILRARRTNPPTAGANADNGRRYSSLTLALHRHARYWSRHSRLITLYVADMDSFAT